MAIKLLRLLKLVIVVLASTFILPLYAVVPTLIQNMSGSRLDAAQSSTSANYVTVNLPNPGIAGNTLVYFIVHEASGRTSTVTDATGGNTWSKACTVSDSSNHLDLDVWVAFNIVAGTRTVTAAFNIAGVPNEANYATPRIQEYNNVVSVDACGGNVSSGTSLTSGSKTPTVTGDLVVQYTFRSGSFLATSYTVGSQSNITWQLADADLRESGSTQWGVYNSISALNPTMSMAGSTSFISAGLFLKEGSAGNTPSGGIRVVSTQHNDIMPQSDGGPSGTFNLQLPSRGNLLYAAFSSGGNSITSITDSNGNTWVSAGVTPHNDTLCQGWYAANAISSNDLVVTVSKDAYDTADTIVFYDIVGALVTGSPFDNATQATGNNPSRNNFNTNSITPSTVNGLIVSHMGVALNTISDTTTAGVLFDSQYYDNNTGTFSQLDENNGWAHYYNTSTASITFGWHPLNPSGNNIGNWAAMSVAFKAAPITTVTTILRGKTGVSGKVVIQ